MKKGFKLESLHVLICMVILLVVSLLFVIYYAALFPTNKAPFNPADTSLNQPARSNAINLSNKAAAALAVGSIAPDFTLKKGRSKGGSIELKEQTILLSFLYVHNSSQGTAAQATRSQLTFLKSMYRQYGGKGLAVVLVDESHRVNNVETTDEVFNNFIDDHELQGMYLIKDNADLAVKYGVIVLPTTFLIAKDGTVIQKWQDVALSSQLAFAIQEQMRAPLMEENQPGAPSDSFFVQKEKWPTPAQTIFPGFAAARPLSDKIWLVDGGKNWRKEDKFPIRILVLTDDNIRIRLKATNNADQQSVIVIDEVMELLAEDEGKLALRNIPGLNSDVYSIALPVSIKKRGLYTLEATVTKTETDENLLSGTARIVVE